MTVSESLTDVCRELNNWFDRGQRYFGTFTIKFGCLRDFEDRLNPRQYYRVIGSAFNDGVHLYAPEGVIYTDQGEPPPCPAEYNETFDGAVWAMSVPPNVVQLAREIADWRKQYEAADSPALSPFAMESYKGYTYQMRGGMTDSGTGVMTWQSVFAARLNAYRKF